MTVEEFKIQKALGLMTPGLMCKIVDNDHDISLELASIIEHDYEYQLMRRWINSMREIKQSLSMYHTGYPSP